MCVQVVAYLQRDCSGFKGFPIGSEIKDLSANAEDAGSIPGSGRSPGGENGNPLQFSCLGNPMDGGAWWAIVHRVAKSRTRLSDFTSSLLIKWLLWAKLCLPQNSYVGILTPNISKCDCIWTQGL